MKILLVEDDREISEMLKSFLESEQFTVVTAYDGESACEQFSAETYSLVLLDLMIPKKSGMEVLRSIREKSTVPVIILSAKDTDSDKTLGLGLGADDYVTKPFSVAEVLARVKANIRRSTSYAVDAGKDTGETVMRCGKLMLDTSDYTVVKDGRQIELTAKEFEILKLFMLHPKRVYTKEQIYSLVWNDAYVGDENAVNVSELCRERVLGFYEPLLEGAFQVELGISEKDVYAWGDRQAIGRILDNLLSNAIRYGGDGKYLGVFLRGETDMVCVDVTDRGKGIEKEFATNVFERLYTMEDSRNRDIQGNGLGLTIAKNLSEQMGGVLLLESEPGKRTVFTLKLRRYGQID